MRVNCNSFIITLGMAVNVFDRFVRLLKGFWKSLSGLFVNYMQLQTTTVRRSNDESYMSHNAEGTLRTAPSLITSKSQIDEIMDMLVQHGCRDITKDLDFNVENDYIARGGFGTIYSGRLLNGSTVVVKYLEVLTSQDWPQESYDNNLKHTARELHTWSKCSHPGILPLLGMARFRGRIAMVSPLMSNGRLDRYIAQSLSIDFIEMSMQIAEALSYLHNNGIIHGDIKAANILVSKDGQLKIADFGNAVVSPCTLEITPMLSCCSIRWAAPEILNVGDSKHTAPADVYALGMTILEIITGHPPYIKKSQAGVIGAVLRRELPPRPRLELLLKDEELGNDIWLLITRCWSYEPEDRPTALQAKDELTRIATQVKSVTCS